MKIPAELRARLRDLRLVSRTATTAAGIGLHASRSRGAGLEFSQYRAYEPGDEPRRIDWKLFSRSDRYFVREAERDSPLIIWIVIDASASMGVEGDTNDSLSKISAAKLLAACTIELALRQGDRFGIIGLSGQGVSFISEGSGARQRDRCLLEINRISANGELPSEGQMRRVWERVSAGSMVLFISDGFDESLTALALRLSAAKRDVLSIQLLSATERDFPFTEGYRFVDPETGAELRIDAKAARREYLQRFAEARAELAQRLVAGGVRHSSHVLDQPLDNALRTLFGSQIGGARR